MATYGFDESKNKKEVYTKEEVITILQQAIESGSTAEIDPSLAPIPEAVKEKHAMTNVSFWVGSESEFEELGADVGYFIGRVDQNKNVYIITDDHALASIEHELQRGAERDQEWQAAISGLCKTYNGEGAPSSNASAFPGLTLYDCYIDTTNGNLYYCSAIPEQSSSVNWTMFKQMEFGSGAPGQTYGKKSNLYYDTTNNELYIFAGHSGSAQTWERVLTEKDKLTAGAGINIDENNVISATGGGASDDTYSSLKIVCMGDSLTEGDYGSNPPGTENVNSKNYPYFLGRFFNSNKIVNLGRCGLSASTYWSNYIKNHESELKRADVVVIFLGMNLYLSDTLESDTDFDDYNNYANTTTGNYCKIIEWTMEKTSDLTQICLVTLPYVNPQMRSINDIKTTNNVIKQIGEKYSIPVFDLYNEGGFSKFNINVNAPIDNLHFGYYGYQKLATYIGSKIKGVLTYLNERHKTHEITYSLVNVTSSNTDTTAKDTYSTHITINEGYTITGAKVYMGGLDVTEEVYNSSNHNITIDDIRGDIVIQVVATEGEPYTEVNSIITGGHHAIDTGLKMIPNAQFEIEFQPTEEQTNAVYIAGGFTSWGVNRMSIGGSGGLDFSSGVTMQMLITPTNAGTNNRNIKFSNDGYYIDDTKYANVTANNMTGTLDLYLGAVNYGGTLTAGAKAKIKKWKWYVDGNLTQDLIPVLDENGEPCMYDKVTQSFLYNIGSGQFGYELNGNIIEPT